MCPGSRPATGWMPNRTVTPLSRRRRVSSATGYWAWATAIPYPGVMITLEAPGEDLGGGLGVDLAVLAVVGLAARGGLDAEPARDHRDERAVHRLAHDVGQVRTRRADERAGDDQQVVAEQEPRRGRGPPGVAVEHRHDHRHVPAADRGHQVHTQQQRDDRDGDQHAEGGGDDEPHRERGERDQRAQVQEVLAGQHQRRGLEPRRQLAPGHDRPGERHRADEHADDDLGVVDAQQAGVDAAAASGRRRLRPRGSRSSRPARRRGRRSCGTARSARACRSSARGRPGTARSPPR